MPTELKECPFCDNTKIGVEKDWDIGSLWFAKCIDCGCMTKNYKTKKEAIHAWNTRAQNINKALLGALKETTKELQRLSNIFVPYNDCTNRKPEEIIIAIGEKVIKQAEGEV